MKEFYIEEFYVIGICVLLDEVGCDTSFQIVKRVSKHYIYMIKNEIQITRLHHTSRGL